MKFSTASSSRSTSAKSNANLPIHLLDAQLIQKWDMIQPQLIKSMGLQNMTQNEIKCLRNQPNQATVTLSHGFQMVRRMEHTRPAVIFALYVPNTSSFISIDSEFVHIWKSGIHIQKYPLFPPTKDSNKKIVRGFWNTSKVIYIEKRQIYVVANHQLQVKVLDLHFDCLDTFSNPKPVLSMEYCVILDAIICGEIGSIRVFDIIKSPSYNRNIHVLQERISISDGIDDEWVTAVYCDHTKKRIFAGCGTNILVYDFVTGTLLDRYADIHALSITCITYYKTTEYLITGSKDGSIKIWNSWKAKLYEFREHSDAITGFLLMENICELEKGSSPLLISSSLDRTIRMWNFEIGQALYRLNTDYPCFGIVRAKKNHFYHYTCRTVQLWNVNRYQHTFSLLRSRPKTLDRFEHPFKPARLVSTISDCSIRLLSPVTGSTIATGFPTDKDLWIRQVAYDMENEQLFCFSSDGSVTKYCFDANPLVVQSIWDNSTDLNRETITCICGIELYNLKINQIPAGVSEKYFLVGGTDSGQIHLIHFDKIQKQQFLIQAHATSIKSIRFDASGLILISSTSGNRI
jgi:WD40 repeat protein